MNYHKIYDSLMNRAKTRILEGYVERHHIIPRCFGGSNSSDNIVSLTAKEHIFFPHAPYKNAAERNQAVLPNGKCHELVLF